MPNILASGLGATRTTRATRAKLFAPKTASISDILLFLLASLTSTVEPRQVSRQYSLQFGDTMELLEGMAKNAKARGQMVTRDVDELRPHPSLTRHSLSVPTVELSAVACQPVQQFQEPLVISQEQVILDGYAQWEWARLQGQQAVVCIEYELDEEEALHRLLQSHRRSKGLNDFARILLALDLEPWLQEKARSNQRIGGQHKGSSTLTKVLRLDVRSQIALAAGVSTGNVTKVKQLVQTACEDLQQALRIGQVSIHRAWQWSKETPEQQRRRLFQHLGERGVRKTIRQLVSRHCAEKIRPMPAFPELLRCLSKFDQTTDARGIQIAAVEAPGLWIFVSQELLRAIDSQQELRLTCAINNR